MQLGPNNFNVNNLGMFVIIETVPGTAFHENNFRVVGITHSRNAANKYAGPNRIIKGPVPMLDGLDLPVKTNPFEQQPTFEIYYGKPETPGFNPTTDPAKVNFNFTKPNPPNFMNPQPTTPFPNTFTPQTNIFNQNGNNFTQPGSKNNNQNKNNNQMDID